MIQEKVIQNILQSSFLFQDASPQSLNVAVRCGEVAVFRKEETIYTPGNYRNAIGFILSGMAAVQKGDQLPFNTLRTGDCFGAAALFHPSDAYVSTIIAKVNTQVFFLTDQLLTELFRQDSRIAVNYIAFLSEKIQFLNEKIDSFAAPNTHQNICAFLRNNLCDGEVLVNNGYSQLARQLNMGRASLYRNLDTLEKEGIIRRENRRILVLQPNKLSEPYTP